VRERSRQKRIAAARPNHWSADPGHHGEVKLCASLMVVTALPIAAVLVGCNGDDGGEATSGSFKTTLNVQEKQRAVELIRASQIVREAIGTTDNTVGEPALWQSESGETIGAVVPVTLREPVSLPAGSIPVFEAWCRAPPLIVPSVFSAENITSLKVYVDFGEKSVVALVPEGGTLTYPSDYKPCPSRD
jgi:hypothetical protein